MIWIDINIILYNIYIYIYILTMNQQRIHHIDVFINILDPSRSIAMGRAASQSTSMVGSYW